MISNKTPELLAPAGSLDKLKVAVNYGANAVYLAGLKFGLRSAAENFTDEELIEGVTYAHDKNVKVYVVLNGFLHDSDLLDLEEFILFLEEIKIDAVIVSDLGVIEFVKSHTNIEIHLSTQASCLNSMSAIFWKKIGVTRIVLGRECSLRDAKVIKESAGVEIEMFIHGSMCMAYSGNCVISNFTQGRDSNRGGCAHSCRFEYSIQSQESITKKNYFMSSKDLNGIKLIKDFVEAGIDSVKIEGRMKSHLYAATMSKVYNESLTYYSENQKTDLVKLSQWENELNKVSHRSYTDASLLKKAGAETIFDEREHDLANEYIIIGSIIDIIETEALIIEVRNAFNINDIIEVLPFNSESIEVQVEFIKRLNNTSITRTNPTTLVKIPFADNCEVGNLVRMYKGV